MKQQLSVLSAFYKRIIVPALFMAAGIASLALSIGLSFRSTFVKTFILALPLLHFGIYDLAYKREYAFYYNLGYTRAQLWRITLCTTTFLYLIHLLITYTLR